MKRKLTPQARAAMASGGRKASRADKARAGRKGYYTMLSRAATCIKRKAQT